MSCEHCENGMPGPALPKEPQKMVCHLELDSNIAALCRISVEDSRVTDLDVAQIPGRLSNRTGLPTLKFKGNAI